MPNRFHFAFVLTALALVCLIAVKLYAATTQATPLASDAHSSPLPTLQASPAGAPAANSAPTPRLTREDVLGLLSQAITWHQQIEAQARLATQLDETLFLADDRRIADEVLDLTFDFAHAAAALLNELGQANPPNKSAVAGASPTASPASSSRHLGDLLAHRGELQTALQHLKDELKALRSTPPARRKTAAADVAALEAQTDLAQSRLDSLDAMIGFEQTAGAAATPSGLDAQIEELRRSVQAPPPALAPSAASGSTAASGNAAPAAIANNPADAASGSTGILNGIELLFTVSRKQSTLAGDLDSTNQLAAAGARIRAQLIQMLAAIDRSGLSQTSLSAEAPDIAAARRTKARFDQLTRRSKLVTAAILPLSRQAVLLQVYATNLTRWRDVAHQQFNDALRRLVLRIAIALIALGLVFVAAALWRRLTYKYVGDAQNRYRLLQLRRIALVVAIIFVIIFAFANELGSLATVMGFVAAGVAVALQNVILSVAGYFYMSGRYGLRRNDRVELNGITGDVLEIGFFKLTLMELAGDNRGRQATGRVVVFPNSIVFQAGANLYRQLPGATFRWTELHLSIAPDSDYRLAEKRITEIVTEVFARYREPIIGEYRAIESELGISMDSPRPQTRLQFGPAGLELVVRYPARLKGAVAAADDITRRLVDAIAREPGLRIAALATPLIQAAPRSSADAAPAESAPGAGANGSEEKPASAGPTDKPASRAR